MFLDFMYSKEGIDRKGYHDRDNRAVWKDTMLSMPDIFQW